MQHVLAWAAEPRAAATESEAPRFTALPPLTLYLHLPWCVRKCPYCDFNSYEQRGVLPEREYLDALLRDLEQECATAADRTIESIFIGGGTPSLVSGRIIHDLIAGVCARVAVKEGAEITLEANPGAVDAARFAEYRVAGVNRLSIGVQSFRDPALGALGRVHDAAEAVRALRLAREAGFDNLNIDLMYALPNDSVAGALTDLEAAVGFAPEHLSWYQLTLEPQTAFHRHPPPLPDEDTVAEIEARGRELLARAGYERYEVSAYARTGRRSVHNGNYWAFGDYLGLGAGAHGKITLPEMAAIRRRVKPRNPGRYIAEAGAGAGTVDELITSRSQIAVEFLMNALRLVDGVEVACFEQRAGQPLSTIAGALAEARRRGWLASEPERLQTTAAGLERLNAVLGLFC